tara:strand:+ start:259 stop:546 length:288 start_codon:yes stop_codon:yes gene_type:complete
MGLDLETYRLLDVIDIACYVKIRELTCNKAMCPMADKVKSYLSYNAVYESVDGKFLLSKRFNLTRDDVYIDVWQEAYTNLKEELDKLGIKYTDKI